MDFLHNEAIVQWPHLAKSLNRTVEILISKISKDLCVVKPSQHQILATDLETIINWITHLICIIEANGGDIGVTTLNV